MRELFSAEDVHLLLQDAKRRRGAQIAEAISQRPNTIQSITLDLTSQKLESAPYSIKFPFKSIYIQDASDTLVEVYMKPGNQDSIQSPIILRRNDSLVFDAPIPNAFFHWDAQANKEINIVFFTDAEFRSGSQISVTGGGVSIIDGSTVSTSVATLAVAATTQIVASNSSRKVVSIQNNTGADIWVGDSAVTNSGATLGYKVLTGATFQWRNTGALYGYSIGGGDLLLLVEA